MKGIMTTFLVAAFVGVLTTSTVAVFHNDTLSQTSVDNQDTDNPFFLAY